MPKSEPAEHEWVPQPEPSSAELAAKGVEGALRTPVRIARRIERAVEHPRAALGQVE